MRLLRSQTQREFATTHKFFFMDLYQEIMANIDGRAGDLRNIACSAGLEDTNSLANSQAEQVVFMCSAINAIYLSLYYPLH